MTAAALFTMVVTGGCTVQRMSPPVPAAQMDQTRIPGMPTVRDWGDGYGPYIEQSLVQAWEQRRQAGRATREFTVLALSGGGTNGAFGAGLLCGWTAAGNRPEFDIVTGTSTGALIAPLAFLGPAQDQKLKELYTGLTTDDLFQPRWIFAALSSDAVGESEPLARLVNRVVDADFLRAVAREHAKGRRLFTGTTNLDAQRPVIWDMGAIAASGRPEALALFRKVLMASSAMPALYPPQYFDVEVDGRRYQEMHVDGGTISQVFHVGQVLDFHRLLARMKDFPANAPRRLNVILNGLARPEWEPVEPRTLSIAQRSVATLLKANAAGDLNRIYALSRTEGADFNLACIADDFIPAAENPLDTADMRRLFEHGFTVGRSETAWNKRPPGLFADVSWTVTDKQSTGWAAKAAQAAQAAQAAHR